jgi:hypothetical protein
MSDDGGVTFLDVFDHKGDEISIVATAGAAVRVNLSFAEGCFLKFRSGLRAAPIIQAQDAAFATVLYNA